MRVKIKEAELLFAYGEANILRLARFQENLPVVNQLLDGPHYGRHRILKIQLHGFLARTPKGRQATEKAYRHLGIPFGETE